VAAVLSNSSLVCSKYLIACFIEFINLLGNFLCKTIFICFFFSLFFNSSRQRATPANIQFPVVVFPLIFAHWFWKRIKVFTPRHHRFFLLKRPHYTYSKRSTRKSDSNPRRSSKTSSGSTCSARISSPRERSKSSASSCVIPSRSIRIFLIAFIIFLLQRKVIFHICKKRRAFDIVL